MRTLLITMLTATAVTMPAAAEDVIKAKPGVEVEVGWLGSVGPNCQPNPAPKVIPAKAAGSGQIRLTQGVVQTNSIPSCPGIKLPAVVIFYTSIPSFTGTDTFSLIPGTEKPREYKIIVAAGDAI